MVYHIKNTFIFVLVLLSLLAQAQERLAPGYFRSPLDIVHSVTGTFAEPRPDHLHSGIDFGTNQKQGLNIYAMADGYVSRIKVSAGGYGKVLYLSHPNGTVSVYAHLSAFNVVIDDYIYRKQVQKESWEIELFPDPRLFTLKKGDLVGYSGNTGSSTGPHLHLEIRSEISERPLNPALFGLYAGDIKPPVIRKFMVYPGKGSSINGKTLTQIYSFEKNSGQQQLRLPETISLRGSCYFGVMARDYVSSATNDAGIYALSMLVDSVPYFSYKLDSFAFDETRYVNDLIDYAEYTNKGQRILLLKKSPGNKLDIFKDVKNNGILEFEDTLLHQVVITAADIAGNKTSLTFMIRSEGKADKKPEVSGTRLFRWNEVNQFEEGDVRIDMPPGALFNDLNFIYSRRSNKMNHLSALHGIHRSDVPLFRPFGISLRADSVASHLLEKAVICRLTEGNKLIALPTEYADGWLKAGSNRFGDFLIAYDTLAPQIKALNFAEGRNISALESLKVNISDELSGIRKYRAEAEGKWVMTEYDAKNKMLIIKKDQLFPPGNIRLEIKVSDACGNERKATYKLLN